MDEPINQPIDIPEVFKISQAELEEDIKQMVSAVASIFNEIMKTVDSTTNQFNSLDGNKETTIIYQAPSGKLRIKGS